MKKDHSGSQLLNKEMIREAVETFSETFSRQPTVIGYAPARAEILGNHTDYNEGFVISCSVDMGCLFICAENNSESCNIFASDLGQKASFNKSDTSPDINSSWPNYVKGMYSIINNRYGSSEGPGFDAMIRSDIPSGAGLSSSAALEVASGLAFSRILQAHIEPIDLAKVAQKAENRFVGAQCGLLDQISSLFGKENHFIFTDFRSLEIKTLQLKDTEVCLIMCDTKKKHNLVDSEYNERRLNCEQAARFFAENLERPVKSLRDVKSEDWNRLTGKMDQTVAKRALHVIGENERTIQGKEIIENGLEMTRFGQLMYDSHESSRRNFQNSCPELDFVVNTAANTKGALGARLSGGGFGGSAIILAHRRDADSIRNTINKSFSREFNFECETRILIPSDGAQLINP